MSNIDVVMPVYNGGRDLARVLERVAPQVDACGGRLWVVDDGSSDDTAATLQRFAGPRVSVIAQVNSGRSAARNTGLRHCTADVVVFLDADILVDGDGWLAAHLEAQQRRPGVHMGIVRQVTASASSIQVDDDLIGLCATFRDWAEDDRVAWVCVTGANVSVPREVAHGIGGFDQGFVGWGPEDLEFAFRLRMAGLDTFALGRAAAVHLQPKQAQHYERDRLLEQLRYFYDKHRSAEVRAYVRYVTGQLSMQELFAITTGRPRPAGDHYFRPQRYFERRPPRPEAPA